MPWSGWTRSSASALTSRGKNPRCRLGMNEWSHLRHFVVSTAVGDLHRARLSALRGSSRLVDTSCRGWVNGTAMALSLIRAARMGARRLSPAPSRCADGGPVGSARPLRAARMGARRLSPAPSRPSRTTRSPLRGWGPVHSAQPLRAARIGARPLNSAPPRCADGGPSTQLSPFALRGLDPCPLSSLQGAAP
jgi:hypothetical protein